MSEELRCEGCRRPFRPAVKATRAKWCSAACRQRGYRERTRDREAQMLSAWLGLERIQEQTGASEAFKRLQEQAAATGLAGEALRRIQEQTGASEAFKRLQEQAAATGLAGEALEYLERRVALAEEALRTVSEQLGSVGGEFESEAERGSVELLQAIVLAELALLVVLLLAWLAAVSDKAFNVAAVVLGLSGVTAKDAYRAIKGKDGEGG